MTSIYRPILKMAWQILWRAKYLWFFGLLAVGVMNSGEFNLAIDNYSSISEQGGFLADMHGFYTQGFLGDFGANIKSLVTNFNWAAGILLLLLIVIFLFLLWLSVTAQGGLVQGTYKEYRRQPFDFNAAFKAGRENFWKVLGINVLGRVVIYGVLIIVGAPLAWAYIKQASETGQLLFMLLSFVVLIPLAIIISFLIKYAIIFAVIKKENVWQAIKSGWKLFIKNWVVSIEMAIILFFVSILAGLLMILAAIVLAIPLSLMLYLFYALKIGGLLMFTVVISLLLLIVLLFWIGALLATFQMSCWVLLFDRLTESQVFSKLSRWVAGWSMKKGASKEIEQ